MKRSESALERSKREAFERDVMVQIKRDERAKRSQGKGAWYLKKGIFIFCFIVIADKLTIGCIIGDEKKVKLQAKFESLSGQEAKRVMEKKQKKMAQKEKKSRPFAAGRDREDGPRKRRRAEDGDFGGNRRFKKRD
jgi:ribosomal RNA-processing protein 36